MTFTDAAREVLRISGRPLHYKEITELAIEQNLLSHVGKSPEVTMGARLAATLKKGGDDNPLVRVKPGVFALREWDDDTIKQGLEIRRTTKKPSAEDESVDADVAEDDAPEDADAGANGESDLLVFSEEPITERKAPPRRVIDDTPPSPDEARRAEIVASATEVFAEEDDDDQPILRPVDDDSSSGGDQADGGRRRRRRRRRRGSRSSSDGGGDNGGMPTYTAKALDDDGPSRGPQVIELSPVDIPALEGLAGRPLADAVATILATFDRTVGAVSLRQITETAQRRGKLGSEVQLVQSQIAACVRADTARRSSLGFRPRFRMVGGRVGLTEWLLDHELARADRDLQNALERYREAARRAFAKKCAELPGHAFVELCVTLLERLGVTGLHAIKFPGASGVEVHFAAVLHSPAGVLPGPMATGDGIRLAVVIRKDGRDLGRERVTELRGSVHHYDNATMGWIFSSGQVLSGAREEATGMATLPVSLLDGGAIARLCAEHDIAVVRSQHPVAIADVDFFEALRAS
jgi:hypothetical protein